ncbi:hypothetical protein CWR41_04660 [Cedecea lapagei]|nr:hypothetical protein CWR41_04660 [Cedecea lapagei]
MTTVSVMFEDKLLITSDNALIKKAMKEHVFFLHAHTRIKNPLAVLFLEGEINNYEQLAFILKNESTNLLIFTTDKNIRFISAMKILNNVRLEKIGLPLNNIISEITAFISISNKVKGMYTPNREKNILTISEQRVLFLYIQGVSVDNISKRLNKKRKTIYTQKDNSMKKLGLCTKADLIQKKSILLKIHQDGLL